MDDAPQNPLDRFTSGGWAKGLLRLALGALLVVVVVHYFARDALALIGEREVALTLAGGAAIHLVQRCARIFKWSRIIADAELVPRSALYLLRLQLIGMVANLLLPVSEALKVWAVARNKREAIVAGESIALETALHSAMIGAAGLVGVLATRTTEPWLWAAAVLLSAVPVALIAIVEWRRGGARTLRMRDARVLAWCALETACQLAIYALAIHAIGVEVEATSLLALAPLLFVADLLMLTPSGLGLREALFAVVLHNLSNAPPNASVAVALLITAMLLIATMVGGAFALALPQSEREL